MKELHAALFGEAIYIATSEIYVTISYCTTLAQITFYSNFAGTLEADVFIEDGFSVPFMTMYTKS